MGLLNEGGPAFKFTEVGDTFEGVVLSQSEMEDRDPNGTVKTWKDGTSKTVYILNCESKTDGEDASIWVRGNMVKAIREAAREVKVKDLVGHEIKIQFYKLGDPTTPGFAPPKLFRVKVGAELVRQPTPAAAETWDDSDDPF
jgi:hypothetical protein